MAKRKIARDLLFVRHANANKRAEMSSVKQFLKRPFADFGSSSQDSSNQTTFHASFPVPTRRSVIVGRFPKQDWFSVYCRTATIKRILKANESSIRLEFLRIQYDDAETLVELEILKGGKSVCKFVTGKTSADFTMTGESTVMEIATANKNAGPALKALRKHLGLTSLQRTTIDTESEFVVINEAGETLEPVVCGVLVLEGPYPSTKKPKETASLARALEKLDLVAVRKAISDGASLERLPDSTLSPLQSVLFTILDDGGKECAQALIDAGASTGSLMADCFAGYIPPELSVAIVEFLIENGAEVNATAPSGHPPIFNAVLYRNVQAVELLMQHGADATATLPSGYLTTIEWAQQKFDETAQVTKKQVLADILTHLTGERVFLSAPESLSDELQAENDRFLIALRAQQMLAALPVELRLEDAGKNKLRANKEFSRLNRELKRLGFKKNGDRMESTVAPMFIVTYSNPALRMDAIISERWWTKEVGCRIVAYGEAGELFSANSLSDPPDADFDPDFLHHAEFMSANPQDLVKELTKLVTRHKAQLSEAPARNFAARYKTGYDRVIAETRRLAEQILATSQICFNGQPARFERRRFYLNLAGWDDPTYSSQRFADGFANSIEEHSHRDDAFNICLVVRNCFRLLAIRHLQFVGAPSDSLFLKTGRKAALTLFKNLKTKWKRDLEFANITDLQQALLICQCSDDNDSMREICDCVQPRMATSALRAAGDPPLAMGQVMMIIASHFRKRAIPKLAELRKTVATGRSKRAKALLTAFDAFTASDEAAFVTSLTRSLLDFLAHPDQDVGENHLESKFALPESILCNAAFAAGLQLELPLELRDLMIAKEDV